jgi:hypothetical protein
MQSADSNQYSAPPELGKTFMQHHDYKHFGPPGPVVVVEDLAQEAKKRGLNGVENACSRYPTTRLRGGCKAPSKVIIYYKRHAVRASDRLSCLPERGEKSWVSLQ